jgi:hypothetical protein
VETQAHRVRLGIEAPADVAINRAEIAREMQQRPGGVRSLADTRWLHMWQQGEYQGATRCTEQDIYRLMKPSDASYRGVFYALSASPDWPDD